MAKKIVNVKPGIAGNADEGSMQEKIRVKAYELYEKSGRNHGRDMEHWFKAEAIVKFGKGA